MLDFLFRRGNPTNDWIRSPGLHLTAALDEPALNGVPLGAPFERLSSLGRNDSSQFGTLCYFDLGVGIDRGADGTFQGFTIVLMDRDGPFQPYRGSITWRRERLDIGRLTRDELPEIFGKWYWLDTDDDESIAFYEYRGHEIQIELAPSGAILRLIVARDPLMADRQQRAAYGVDKAWPPDFGT